MADSTTFKYAITTYAHGVVVVHQGEVRMATDPTVTANPQYWVSMTDADLSAGKKVLHT